jgi:hypothetical protein
MSINPVLTRGFVAEATVTAKRGVVAGTDVDRQCNVPGGACQILGVVRGAIDETFVAGKAVDVDMMGIVEMQATAAVITQGQFVVVDNAGRAVAVGAGAATLETIGKALTTTGGALDEIVEVQLVPGRSVTHA